MRTLLLLSSFFFCALFGFGQRQVVFYTTVGNFTVEIDTVKTPITGGNFLSLVREGYYDGVIFHRVIDNFMIQGGRGSTTKPNIQDEFDSTLSNVKGTISMANTGAPNSGTSQFFINLVNNTRLDFDKPPFSSKHPVFGHVVENFSVVDSIGNVNTDFRDKPVVDVVMDSLRIIPIDTSGSPGDTTGGPGDTTKAPAMVGNGYSMKSLVKVYPNPIQSDSKLQFSRAVNHVVVELIDATGKLAARGSYDQVVSVPINDLLDERIEQGLYFIRVSTEESTEVIRVLIP